MRWFPSSLLSIVLLLPQCLWAAHGYSLWGELGYPPDFPHFQYVNPQAPKGGELRLVSNLRTSTFDKYNPFTIKGTAPAYVSGLLFESLLVAPLDEVGAAYGLLAESVEVGPDRQWAVFRIRENARFHNGDPVLAADVKYSFDTLNGPHVSPAYRSLLADVAGADVLGAREVRFRFKRANRELPLTVGSLPIFSPRWGMVDGKPRRFDEVVTDVPVGSGPYRIGPVRFGKDITYVRDTQYWGQALPVRVGQGNFDRISVKIYKDNTARLEALKAGEFDLMRFFSAGDWARRVNGRRFDSGQLRKAELPHRLPTGFQSYVLNTRRPVLRDIRVRQALGLALDYEWMNRQMFYGAYQRVSGLFGNTECASSGVPVGGELALLQAWRGQVPHAVFGPAYSAPRTDQPDGLGLRNHLRLAQQLLREAGWVVKNGVLSNAQGTPMVLEYLDSNEGGARVVAPWARNLKKIGIDIRYRAVDFALYQQRLQKFDFDITSLAFAGTHNPGQEYADLFGSAAADTEDSGNLAGLKSPAVDALLGAMTRAPRKAALLDACRALDRVVSHSHVLIPQWSSTTHRLAYDQWRLARPEATPPYSPGEAWVIDVWWSRSLTP
jgi:microcin C transport system substrate-binding protein